MSELVQDKDYLKYLKYKMKYTKLKKEMEGGAGKYFPKFPPKLTADEKITESGRKHLAELQKYINEINEEIEKHKKTVKQMEETKKAKILSLKKLHEGEINAQKYKFSQNKDVKLLIQEIKKATKALEEINTQIATLTRKKREIEEQTEKSRSRYEIRVKEEAGKIYDKIQRSADKVIPLPKPKIDFPSIGNKIKQGIKYNERCRKLSGADCKDISGLEEELKKIEESYEREGKISKSELKYDEDTKEGIQKKLQSLIGTTTLGQEAVPEAVQVVEDVPEDVPEAVATPTRGTIGQVYNIDDMQGKETYEFDPYGTMKRSKSGPSITTF